MQDNDSRFAADMAQLDAELGRAMEHRASPGGAGQDHVPGEESSLRRGLLAGMTFAGAPGRR